MALEPPSTLPRGHGTMAAAECGSGPAAYCQVTSGLYIVRK